MVAATQEKANPKVTATMTATASRPGLGSGRNPMARPASRMTAVTRLLRAVSTSARPATTEEREMGSERKRR
jgi:hypothetical protein